MYVSCPRSVAGEHTCVSCSCAWWREDWGWAARCVLTCGEGGLGLGCSRVVVIAALNFLIDREEQRDVLLLNFSAIQNYILVLQVAVKLHSFVDDAN